MCLSKALVCNGQWNCPNGADERNCGESSGMYTMKCVSARPFSVMDSESVLTEQMVNHQQVGILNNICLSTQWYMSQQGHSLYW